MLKLPTLERCAELIDFPLDRWHNNCHAVSLAFLQAGIVQGRIARGVCRAVPAQHSWIAVALPHQRPVDLDVYDTRTVIIDPTLWTFDYSVNDVWQGTIRDGRHHPHGLGNIWKVGQPTRGDGPSIDVPGLSDEACRFLLTCFPRGADLAGWRRLASGPMQGWPAREVIEAMLAVPELVPVVPIDIVGMVTNTNPGGLYLVERIPSLTVPQRAVLVLLEDCGYLSTKGIASRRNSSKTSAQEMMHRLLDKGMVRRRPTTPTPQPTDVWELTDLGRKAVRA